MGGKVFLMFIRFVYELSIHRWNGAGHLEERLISKNILFNINR